ncbi:diphthine synthase [Thermococcus gammatolerans]|uniref:Diphthine synthase n=1 Tax=Thermococcus gammatolerans (strain DSM 15229 / JCM 11827 / EJ3) TaxID=593117 RepID=DPHB_THEGJ|nr:diphthine synthase [Thermococcus gammatolerans]C5A3K4.1 RecName: Full=Diphthine synthase; AltName: Full=Diphthamide biosynthesis methyltransferase [Thermococcus gammatolerans EJ3]ACS32816.1 Diphthine synthase (Diphtamide biosynthesis methyltransferase) (dph5) [Thermococcus gammatolerans EJ3]
MALYFIGLGLYDERDITLKGLKTARKCDKIFAEFYTSLLAGTTMERIEGLIGKPIIRLSREDVELNFEKIVLPEAKEKDVAFLTAGDPMVATTHSDLRIRAKKAGVESYVIHAPSIYSAVAVTGLQIYKFGKSATVAYPERNWFPTSYYDVIKENRERGLHTLLFLDIKAEQNRYMTANEAMEILLQVEDMKKEGIFTPETLVVVLARAGSLNPTIRAGYVKDMIHEDFGRQPHVLIVPGRLHVVEAEYLVEFAGAPEEILEEV